MNPKNSRKKSPIHENADANITCDFGDGDISRSRSFLSNTCTTGANERMNEHSHVDFLNLIIDYEEREGHILRRMAVTQRSGKTLKEDRIQGEKIIVKDT